MNLFLLGVRNFDFPGGVATAELSLLQRNTLDTHLPGVDLDALPLPSPLASVSPRRAMEYRLGRLASNIALASISPHKDLIPGRNEHGAPIWPEGLCGAITHCQEYSAAAVAESRQFRAVGLDVENCLSEKLISAVSERFMNERERKILRMINTSEAGEEMMFTAGISAKESVIKCLYSLGASSEISQIQIRSGRRKSPISIELEVDGSEESSGAFLVSVLQDNFRVYSSTFLRR